MSKPIVHAMSSAKKFGGHWRDYFPIHDRMDSSKAILADVRHRALFHGTHGASIMAGIFPNHSTERIAALVEQHCMEDLGVFPRVEDYQNEFPKDSYLAGYGSPHSKPHADLERQCLWSAKKFGGQPEHYAIVHEFLDEYPPFVLHHAFGVYLTQDIFGITLINSERKDVVVRDVAEQHVLLECGYIPSAQDWLSLMRMASWMSGSKKASFVLVD
jgi:hypothetical protein